MIIQNLKLKQHPVFRRHIKNDLNLGVALRNPGQVMMAGILSPDKCILKPIGDPPLQTVALDCEDCSRYNGLEEKNSLVDYVWLVISTRH